MRIQIFIILFLFTNLGVGQKINYSIEFGPNISFSANNQFALGYSLPVSPATGQAYKIFNNTYERNGSVGVGAAVGFRIDYKLSQVFCLISGLNVDYFNNKITTRISAPPNIYLGSVNEHPQLTLGENINGYIPSDEYGQTLWRLLVDENGMAVNENPSLFESYRIEEKINTIYLSIPLKFGFDINKNIQLSLGMINSLLICSTINTTYLFIVDNRILKNNISTVNNFMFSIIAGLSFKVSNKLSILVNYQRSITDMIELNSRYDVKDGNKLNNFNIGLNILISNKKEE